MRTTTLTLIAAVVALAFASTANSVEEPAAMDAIQIGSAEVTISIKDNTLYFSQVGESFSTGTGQAGGMVLNSGDIDLSGFPPGDVLITAQLDDLAYGAGYRFSADPWQAVAIAVDPPGAPEAPKPVFGQENWPAQFEAPVVTADQRSVSWTDLDSDHNVYEYSVAVTGPNGVVVLDPKIQPGGSTTGN